MAAKKSKAEVLRSMKARARALKSAAKKASKKKTGKHAYTIVIKIYI